MSKFLKFEDDMAGIIWVYNKRSRDALGWIEHYKPWKQCVFAPYPDTVFSHECLRDILKKVEEMNKNICVNLRSSADNNPGNLCGSAPLREEIPGEKADG